MYVYANLKNKNQRIRRFGCGKHFRQLCGLALTVAMLAGLFTVAGAAPPPLLSMSEQPSIFTPVYDSDTHLAGAGTPGALINITINVQNTTATTATTSTIVTTVTTSTTVNELGYWVAPLPTVTASGNDIIFAAGDEIAVTQEEAGMAPGAPAEATITEADAVYGYRYIVLRRLNTALGGDFIPGWIDYDEYISTDVVVTDLAEGEDYPPAFESAGARYAALPFNTILRDTINNNDIFIFAVFYEEAPDLLKVIVDYNDGIRPDDEIYALEDDIVDIDAGARAGYTFGGWTADTPKVTFATTANAATEFIMPDTDVKVTATWQPAGGGGSTGGGGGGGGSGYMGGNPPEPGDKGKEPADGSGEPGDDTSGGDLSGVFLPRYEMGLETGFAPLSIFNPIHIAYLYGYEEGDVKPDTNILRSEASALIFRILSDPDRFEHRDNPFEFADWEWYYDAVTYLAGIGVIDGYEDGTFRGDNNITRAEFAALICKFGMDEGPISRPLSDIAGHWAEEYIKIGASNGWISGYPDGTFRPDSYIERAEVVSLINRLLYRGIEAEDIPGWAPEFWDLTADHWAYADIMEAATGHDFRRKDNGYEIWTRLLD